jgi:hypothetical protein
LYSLTPANCIFDILRGSCDFAIVNPWVDLPGVSKVPLSEFMKVKEMKNNTNGQTGVGIMSPKIVIKNGSNFTDRITFTADDGKPSLNTTFKPYGLYGIPLDLNMYKNKIKVLQKVTVSRGKYDESNTGLMNECLINYQLSQAYEMAYLLRALNVKEIGTIEQINAYSDVNIIASIYKRLTKNDNIPPELATKINNYCEYVKSKKIPETYSSTLKSMHDDDDKHSLFNMFSKEIKRLITEIEDSHHELFSSQDYFTQIHKNKYNPLSPACSIRSYKGKNSDGVYSGKSFYTDYTIKCADKSTNKTMRMIAKNKFIAMSVEDYYNMVNKPQIGKLYLNIDFDNRTYGTLDKNAIGIRYILQLMIYKPYVGGQGFDDIDVGNIDGMDLDYPDESNQFDESSLM